jgi:hypothetical protein
LLEELVLRFLIGGATVSAFAVIGDVLRPKSFAGLFGAAPSVALAGLALVIVTKGSSYAAVEARSMMAGAAAFLLYTACACWLMLRRNSSALRTAAALIPLWFAAALGLWLTVLR